MLKMDPYERLLASECLEESAKLRKAKILAQNLETDLGTPTEKMSSSAIMEAFRAAGYGGQQIATEEAETQINLLTLSLLKSDWQPGGDGGDPEEAGTSFDFPTLSTLKSVRQPGKYLKTLTQIWDPPGDAVCRSKENKGSQQEVKIGTGNGSDKRHSKRQRIEWPSVLPSNSQSSHTTPEIISLTALSDWGPSSVNTGLHRNSKDGPNLTKTSSHMTEWEGSYLRPFRLSELQTGHSVRARLTHP
ncbi:hypothetical protein K469DRAFT_758114 [Zopfia rhizophila CBS 207.26]|uniref:Uncharacterized protein n=1 Tax=Zopfia rhizophila CBS 207.26 TaxID=1314779 RepID=A0A6A6EVJ2_9PEZI|nr:hypothetical protein K469DRAFT_758114 [Zopfia rhizophila CBS 207.26]